MFHDVFQHFEILVLCVVCVFLCRMIGRDNPGFTSMASNYPSGPGGGRRTSTAGGGTGFLASSPEMELGLKAGVAPHLIQLIERVKANHDAGAFAASTFTVSKVRWEIGVLLV